MQLSATANVPALLTPARGRYNLRAYTRRIMALAGLLTLGAAVLLRYGPALLAVARDQATLQTFIQQIGWWGPAVLIGVNVLQIVIAPIPGYAVYLAAGYLYGPWWGGLWGSLGLLAGGMAAMAVARRLGRPLVVRLIGAETLTRWGAATHSDNVWVWGAILLSPIGDAPFLLAGLARISYGKILLLTIITRVPAAFAAAAIGAGAVQLSGWRLTLIALALAIPLLLLQRGQTVLVAKAEGLIKGWLSPASA